MTKGISRTGDPMTSIIAGLLVDESGSIRTALATATASSLPDFTDEELYNEYLNLKEDAYSYDASRFRHARQSLIDMGLMEDTGQTRASSRNRQMRIFRLV